MPHSSGIHHIHKRKRISQKIKPYPHKHSWIRFLDNLLVVIAVIGPLMTLPQILTIYIGKDATGVSVSSWTLFALFNIPWIIYGFVHKEKPIIISTILWFLTNVTVVIGALIY